MYNSGVCVCVCVCVLERVCVRVTHSEKVKLVADLLVVECQCSETSLCV